MSITIFFIANHLQKVHLEKPNYFADYDTTVNFISEEELLRDHSGIPHGGFVFRTGKTGWNNEFDNVIEYSLKLDSNTAFTSSEIVAYTSFSIIALLCIIKLRVAIYFRKARNA